MKIKILGCYAATPRTITNPTSQVLEIKSHMFLIDCGEGTQVQLRKHKIKFSQIEHIFIFKTKLVLFLFFVFLVNIHRKKKNQKYI